VKDPRSVVRAAGSPGGRSADFIAIEGIPVHSTVPRFRETAPKRDLGRNAACASACRARVRSSPATRVPGAPREGPRASLLPMHGARVCLAGSDPWRSLPSTLVDATRPARGSQDEDRTLARANPRVARTKSAEVGKRIRGPRSAIPPGNGRVHGDPSPSVARKGAAGVQRRRDARERGGSTATRREEGPSRAFERTSQGEDSCRMEGVSARPPAVIVHAITRGDELGPLEGARIRESGRDAQAKGRRGRQRLGRALRVRSTEAGRLSVKQRAPWRIHAG